MSGTRTEAACRVASMAELFTPRVAKGGIVFQNPGLIELAAVTTLGVSVKEGDLPIGFFGTGLKFAIATILREGGTVTLYRGLDRHEFSVRTITVRNEKFQQVCMDGQPLGFTTQLGRTWKPWMAFRELASNCCDEDGRYFDGSTTGWEPQPDATTIVATGAFNEVWHERRKVMLESIPLKTNEHVEIHEGPSAYVFYRGVRIHTLDRPSAFRYNIRTPLDLTEDRTAANYSQVEIAIERGLGALENRAMLRTALTCGEGYTEHYMNVPKYGHPGETFRDVARELTLGSESLATMNPAAAQAAREMAMGDMQPGHSVALEPHQQKMLTRAKEMLTAGGFNVAEFPLIVIDTLGANIHGMARDGKIFVALMAFDKGTRELAATIFEEFAHLRSGAGDCTRQFQNWLFDQLLVQAERASGEPF